VAVSQLAATGQASQLAVVVLARRRSRRRRGVSGGGGLSISEMEERKDVGILAMDIYFPPTYVQ
jgi:hypothetical protein